jgi:endonuclease/exonuclease/phosphatase family metal-dependent hydrolase
MNIRKYISVIGWLIGIACVGMLILCYLAYWIPPHISKVLPLIGLSYPFVWPVVLVLACIAAVMKSRVAWVLIFIFLIGLPHFFSYYQFSGGNVASDDKGMGDIKLMSWNVNLLGFNGVNKLVNLSSSAIRDSIISVVDREKPDVLAFQEFLQTSELNHIALIKEKTGLNFHHVKFSHSIKRGRKTGLVIFSRYPIIQGGQVMFSGTTLNGCIYVDLAMDRDTIRVYNTHLQSIRFNSEDYEYLNEETEELKGAERIVKRLSRAFQRREGQVHAIRMHMKTCPYPIIVMGDFNDPPMSYTYRKMTEEMTDHFREKGMWMSSTYAGKFPNFRIDYILSSEEYGKVLSYETLPVELIDHRPIVSTLQLP